MFLYPFFPSYTNPPNPEKARAIRPADTRAIGTPCNPLGTFHIASFSLRALISISARAKPTDAPNPEKIVSIILYLF